MFPPPGLYSSPKILHYPGLPTDASSSWACDRFVALATAPQMVVTHESYVSRVGSCFTHRPPAYCESDLD
ncbi:hypothetical protein WMY93_033806 [Mugilogobius chulae]|uniref:Uncharacterized protein n=1 Tax=Mugilogobius chulae TaxID=88201 RepID=A0AAW0MMD8_9GOBI